MAQTDVDTITRFLFRYEWQKPSPDAESVNADMEVLTLGDILERCRLYDLAAFTKAISSPILIEISDVEINPEREEPLDLNQLRACRLHFVRQRKHGRGSKIWMGRDAKADISVRSAKVSQRHASLLKRRNRWTLTDNESLNGSYVDQAPMIPGLEYDLGFRARIKLASQTEFLFMRSAALYRALSY